MKKNRFFVILSAVLLLAGCKDFTREDKSPAVDNTADSKKAYIYLSTVDFARTLKPDFTTESIANYAVTLSAKKSGETDGTTVASYEKFSELPTSAAPIAIDLGTYIFTLTATDGKNNTLTDTTSAIEIVAGNNPLTFNLKWIEPESFSGAGSFSLTLNIADNVDVTNLISAKGEIYEWDVENAEETSLCDSSNLTITTDSVTQKKSVTYTNDDVEAGIYHVKITLYADNEKTVPLASPYSEIAIITDGQNSNATRTIKALNPVYSINCVADGGTLSDGKNLPSKYTAYTEIMLPNNLEKDNYEFKGWYTNPSFDDNAVDGIPKGSSGNKTFYAMFVPAGGFVYVRGATYDGTETLDPESSVFILNREIPIQDLFVCDHEVTQGEYESYCTYGDTSADTLHPTANYGIDPNYPAYGVSWYDAIVYCNLRSRDEQLNEAYSINGETDPTKWGIQSTVTDDGTKYYANSLGTVVCDFTANGYRLPTEAEWEYLARGGNNWDIFKYSGGSTLSWVGWFGQDDESDPANGEGTVHEVGNKNSNSQLIYDMSGNVIEWCWDGLKSTLETTTPITGPVTSTRRIARGGSFNSPANTCNVSVRDDYAPDYRYMQNGFRVVRTANPKDAYLPQFTVSFDTNGIANIPSQTIQKGGYAAAPGTNPSKDDYTFKGWYTVANPSDTDVPFDFTTTKITQNITLYAAWEIVIPNGFVYVSGATIDFAVGSGDTASRIFTGTPVTVGDLLVCDHEVTQDEYVAVMGTNPTSSGNKSNPADGEVQGNRPVDSVSWYAAIAYCNIKSESEGRAVCYSISGITSWTTAVTIPTDNNATWNSATYNQDANGYRLLTEAEWEYVARGGKGLTGEQFSYSGSNSLDNYAWYAGNASSKTHEVKKKLPNGLNVYDMTGNVREWCWDLSDSKRVTRGGCTGDSEGADSLKNKGSTTYFYAPTVEGSANGFRICRTAP